MKALVVEPSRLVALMLASMFGKHGIETLEARGGEEALKTLAHHRVDLLCFAYELGDMTGVDFYVAAKARGLADHRPALLFSSTHDREMVARALEAGVTECFVKNRMGELDDFVGKFARGSHARLHGAALLVEDSATAAVFCRKILERLGLRVEHCKSAEAAIAAYATRHFDLVVSDYMLAGVDTGLALIRAVRASRGKKALTPLLVMSALDDTARRVEILRNGANDFVPKPVVAEELEMRVVNLLTMRALVQRLESQHEMLRDMVMHDPLTGLFNRHYLNERVPVLCQEVRARGQEVSLVIIDLDHFKRINDTHGHKAGDAVLEATAELLQRHVRGREIVARIGGEEFVAILPGSGLTQAAERAEALRSAIAALQPAGIPVTASLGVAARQAEETYEPLFKRADAAVYRAKQAGRDRVEISA